MINLMIFARHEEMVSHISRRFKSVGLLRVKLKIFYFI